jgi:hypothetical protein
MTLQPVPIADAQQVDLIWRSQPGLAKVIYVLALYTTLNRSLTLSSVVEPIFQPNFDKVRIQALIFIQKKRCSNLVLSRVVNIHYIL